MRIAVLTSLICIVCFAGCRKKSSKGHRLATAVWAYEATENGCSTGVQSFNSLKAYCDGLKNDDLNKGCAAKTRFKLFQEAECTLTEHDHAQGAETPEHEPAIQEEN